MSKRSFSALALLAILLLSFSVLSVQAQDAAPTATPNVAEIGSGGTHISFWNGLTGSDGVTLNEMLTQFAAENPDVSVTVEIIAWNTLYQKLQTAFVAGTYPDVFMLHASEVPQYASFGVLRDMGDQYTSGGGWLPDDDVSATTMSGMMYDGVNYGIPLDNHGRGLWINKTMFEAAGLSTDPATAPTTYEGWVELFQKLTLDANGNNALSPDFDPANVVQWGYTVGEWPNVNFLAALYQNGGSFLSEDGSTITINSEAGITALQQAVDLVYTYHVSPPSAGFDTWQGFGAGTVAVLPTGTWYRNQSLLQSDIDSMAWPNWQWGPNQATWFGTHTFMLPAGLEGEKLDAALKLIQWVSENQVTWASSGQVPARLSAQAALNPEEFPSNILLGQTFSAYGIQDPRTTVTQELLSLMDASLQEALNGIKPADQALNEAAELMQEALDRA
ncbi:MAG: ABC transporter substrate-binding protein [Anaerolineae bacterium]|nr:ABC transporter substrate-binding protein [Anaerolineae bacterium]NUQ04021.1 ABC transporter substrate-binding protein [Anaerolineae bacterium]